jgi:hypothetical protein
MDRADQSRRLLVTLKISFKHKHMCGHLFLEPLWLLYDYKNHHHRNLRLPRPADLEVPQLPLGGERDSNKILVSGRSMSNPLDASN